MDATAEAIAELSARRGEDSVQRREDRLRQLADFNALLAQANQIIARVEDEPALLQSICDIAVGYGHVSLAWVGTPDETGRIQVLAAAGRTGYLKDIFISVDPSLPEANGLIGDVWREQKPFHIASFEGSAALAPWRDRARQHGLMGAAAMPIRRGGRVFGVLAVYHSDEGSFEEAPRAVLETLAQDVSRGLDRLDAVTRERQLAALQRTLLENTVAGICLTRGSRMVEVNSHFVRMLGYGQASDLVGSSARMIYPDKAEFARVSRLYATLRESGAASAVAVRFRRQDGQEIVCDVAAGLLVADPDETVVWTLQDVTERHRLQRQLEYQALHDILTDIPNRRALDLELPRAIARADRSGQILALGIVDLDDFKVVNDAYGHEHGDRLLQEFARRLRTHLRQTDFVARLGGDEFVILLEDLGERDAAWHLDVLLARLHKSVEQPFEMGPKARAEVGMSMGVARNKHDGQEGDALLRRADASLYFAKAHKVDRTSWWQRDVDPSLSESERDATIDPYGATAESLLLRGADMLHEVMERFVTTEHEDAVPGTQIHAVLEILPAETLKRVQENQISHLRFLLSPAVARSAILRRAREIGVAEALLGISGPERTQGFLRFHRALVDALNGSALPVRARYDLLMTTLARMQDDLVEELTAQEETLAAYAATEFAPLPAPGARWVDVAQAEVASLGELPGVVLATVYRLNSEGAFTPEHTAGPRATEAFALLRNLGLQILADAQLPEGQGLIGRAWRSQQICTTAFYQNEQGLAAWREVGKALGIRSMLTVPINDVNGNPVAVIGIHGAYAAQFESQRMQRFARSLRQRWQEVWNRCTTPAPTTVVPLATRQAYREHLFADGLSLRLQPVVPLRGQRETRLEALARLRMRGGQLIPPSDFLPLLGDAELARLFRMTLDSACRYLGAYRRKGLPFGLSVNLAPSTLLDANCRDWVAEALERHGLEASSVTLELLESQVFDIDALGESIERLSGLGVQLALDDLGAGHNSLERLSALPFHSVKIDRGLTARLRTTPIETMSLLRALVQMGTDLGKDVVVEGLEDGGMVEVATVLGAPYGQGYAFARPLPAAEVIPWYASFKPRSETERVSTFLGALAYHWQSSQIRAFGYEMSAPQCPLHAFLEERGLLGRPQGEWHDAVHERGASAAEAGRKLRDWLVDQVRHEAGA